MNTKLIGGLIFCVLAIILVIVIVTFVKKLNDPLRVGVTIIDKPVEMAPNMITHMDELPVAGNNHTYGFWLFVNQWEQTPGIKYIFQRKHDTNMLNVVLGSVKPDLEVFLTDRDGNRISRSPDEEFAYTDYDETHKLPNIPLQTWNYINLSIHNKTLDLYLNGKLARTFLLARPLQTNETSGTIRIGGEEEQYTFNGFLSRFRYVPRALYPREIYNIYLKGPAKSSDLSSTPIKSQVSVNFDQVSNSPSCASAN